MRQRLILERLGFANYSHYLRTEHWKRLSAKVKVRDNATCRFCLQPFHVSALQVHHLTYDRLEQEWHNGDIDHLVTICIDCHERAHCEGIWIDEFEYADALIDEYADWWDAWGACQEDLRPGDWN